MRTHKKIAIVSDAVWPFNKGGKEKRIYDITTRLVAQGYEVTIYCMQWWKGERTIVRDGVTFHAISPYYPLYTGERRSITQAVRFALHCFKLLREKFDVIEVDAVPHFPIFAVKLVCMLKRKKMIVTWHEVWGLAYWKKYLGVRGYIAYAVERMTVKMPDVIVAVSEHTANDLRTKLHAKKPITVIRNGFDVAEIVNDPLAPRGADILFAGRLLVHKNVDVLLRALQVLVQRNPKVSLIIVGDGPEKAALEELAKDLNIEKNVSFVGFLEDHRELYRIMQASGVFVLPSSREGFGIAALEANACGMPVVTIDHAQNATTELIVNGENGMVTPLDATAIADAIELLLNLKKDRAFYRRYAEQYSWSRVVSEMEKVYADS